ncbi:unnamed protein product [Blepharisma stoltei]|uniref:ubiquitinyl hydrolase 1 n=1 Tax=Blepharisma stoltei TaxID=1481888 RepID=A0AAU9K6Z3_9CILI|nr:unnamed protein product [Blepharisma stoltei]
MNNKLQWELESFQHNSKSTQSLKLSYDLFQESSLLDWQHRQVLSRGFKNMGNTCFINSTLQCLLYTPPLQNIIHRCKKVFCTLCCFKRLFKSSTRIPDDFLKYLPRFSQSFSLGKQEDAHELLRFLVERMERNVVRQIFGGVLRSKVQCLNCHFESEIYENFLDISLDLSDSDLERCLANFCKNEFLDGMNLYFCAPCGVRTVACKQFIIKSPPLILTLHLKRFTNEGKKDMTHVKFPEKLNFQPYLLMPEQSIYELYAVLVHMGYSSRSGHYYSYIKGPNNEWYIANDLSVLKVNLNKVLNDRSAYILFYKKSKVEDVDSDGADISLGKKKGRCLDFKEEKLREIKKMKIRGDGKENRRVKGCDGNKI